MTETVDIKNIGGGIEIEREKIMRKIFWEQDCGCSVITSYFLYQRQMERDIEKVRDKEREREGKTERKCEGERKRQQESCQKCFIIIERRRGKERGRKEREREDGGEACQNDVS